MKTVHITMKNLWYSYETSFFAQIVTLAEHNLSFMNSNFSNHIFQLWMMWWKGKCIQQCQRTMYRHGTSAARSLLWRFCTFIFVKLQYAASRKAITRNPLRERGFPIYLSEEASIGMQLSRRENFSGVLFDNLMFVWRTRMKLKRRKEETINNSEPYINSWMKINNNSSALCTLVNIMSNCIGNLDFW